MIIIKKRQQPVFIQKNQKTTKTVSSGEIKKDEACHDSLTFSLTTPIVYIVKIISEKFMSNTISIFYTKL